jgi:eukaryotic-like serine/threonine-protein kinase
MANDDFLKNSKLINDQYLVFTKIDTGGFADIWKAYDFSLKNFVVLKQLLPQFTQSKFIEMFYKEALIAKNLIHDNIVRVHHFWHGSDKSYYILMDYVRGTDLEKLIAKCNSKKIKLSWENAVHITGCILKALDYANRLARDPVTGEPYGIVYRDISPGNILISFEGSAKISDFGIAKTQEELADFKQPAVLIGKYPYMSPEQIKGGIGVDHSSDIFSVGVLLYEMLTGTKLYSGDPELIKEEVLKTKFNTELLASLGLPPGLDEIVRKAVEKEKDKRYEKAIEMFRDLRRLLRGKETEELAFELTNFMNFVFAEEMAAENEQCDFVKKLGIKEIRTTYNVVNITCKDFIPGEQNEQAEPVQESPTQKAKTQQTFAPAAEFRMRKAVTAVPAPVSQSYQSPQAQQGEEKGKTIFEEVGDWLVIRFKKYKRWIVRSSVAIGIALVLFVIVDTFAHLTPVGRSIYSFILPPDIIISTVPSGARVNIKDRDGQVLFANLDSSRPIELRKIPPKTYLITATKEGFTTVGRIIRIEPQFGNARRIRQKIDISLDLLLNINSVPQGATVFVDGNRFTETPWTGKLAAGEHTLRLVLAGFEDLGSTAKETKEGQCNVDFTQPKIEQMFTGMDRNYWQYSTSEEKGENAFNITGFLFKKINIDSVPTNKMVHVQGQSKSIGTTPLIAYLKAGEYKVNFLDQEGKYEEHETVINVDKNVDSNVKVYLRKWVTIKSVIEGGRGQDDETTVQVKGRNVDLKRKISPDKPIRLALYPDKPYTFDFLPTSRLKGTTLKNVNIDDKSVIVGKLELIETVLKVTVKDEISNLPIKDAYVWIEEQLKGRTDKNGVWQDTVKFGTATVTIVADGYVEKTFEKNFAMGAKEDIVAALASEASLAPLPSEKNERGLQEKDKSLEPFLPEKTRLPDINIKDIEPTRNGDEEILICPNCGQEYRLVPGERKPRFCTNCGKTFR